MDNKNRYLNIQSLLDTSIVVYLLNFCVDKMKKSKMYSKSVCISRPQMMAWFSWSCRSKAVPAVLLQLSSEFKGLPASVPELNSLRCQDHTANTLRVLVWSFKPKML